MSEHVSVRIDDEDLLAAIEAAKEDEGSRSEALRTALRSALLEEKSDDDTADSTSGLPKAAREGYEALREYANVGERLSKDQANSIIAQRVQLEKDTVEKMVVRKLHGAGWVAVEQGMYDVGIVIRPRTASDGGRDDDRDAGDVLDDSDDVDAGEASARLDELAAAAGGDAR